MNHSMPMHINIAIVHNTHNFIDFFMYESSSGNFISSVYSLSLECLFEIYISSLCFMNQ